MAVITLMGMGCRSLPEVVETDRLRNFPAEVNAGDIVHVATGEKITFSQLADSFDGARIVYVGEVHSNRESHELELQVLKEFYKRNGDNIAVGMEMFKRPHQDILDKWTDGEISEKDLLFLTDWDNEWGYDYNNYKEIMDFIRDNKIPVVAMNIKREFQKKISKNGIEGLSEEEKETLPEIDTTDVYHRRYLERIMQVHGHGDTDMSEAFERFYLVQCVWEDVMADSISKYLSSPEGKDKNLLVFIGGGHIIYHSGVPKRVYRRNHLPYLTITTYEMRDLKSEGDHPLFASDIPLQPADYVNVVELTRSKETKVMLGVIIRNLEEEKKEQEEQEEQDKKEKEQKHKVVIDSVREVSPAGKAGLKAGDIILSMDDESVSKLFDVIYHVRQKKAGDTCVIEILRGEEKMPVEVTFFETKGHGKK